MKETCRDSHLCLRAVPSVQGLTSLLLAWLGQQLPLFLHTWSISHEGNLEICCIRKISAPTLYIPIFCKPWKVLCDLISPSRSGPEQAEEFTIHKSWQKPKIKAWLLTLLQLNECMDASRDRSLSIQEIQKSKHRNLDTKNICELTKLDSSSEGI